MSYCEVLTRDNELSHVVSFGFVLIVSFLPHRRPFAPATARGPLRHPGSQPRQPRAPVPIMAAFRKRPDLVAVTWNSVTHKRVRARASDSALYGKKKFDAVAVGDRPDSSCAAKSAARPSRPGAPP